MFAHRVFGGTLEGNAQHQYLRTSDGHVLDLTDWTDESAYSHDASFFHNPEHAESMGHCKARVDRWVAEFMEKMPLKESFGDDDTYFNSRSSWWVAPDGTEHELDAGETHEDFARALEPEGTREQGDLQAAGWLRVNAIDDELLVDLPRGVAASRAQRSTLKSIAIENELALKYVRFTLGESLLHEGKVRIEHWSEDMDDPW